MASQPMQPQKIAGLGSLGIIRPAAVDDILIPDGAVTDVRNFDFSAIGRATVRSGIAALGSTVLTSRPAVGLWNAQSGTALAVFSNGGSATIYSFNGSAWSVSLDGGTASVRIRFFDFGSYTCAINFIYNTYSSARYWNAGSSRHWHNTGNPLNMQNMWGYTPQVCEVYKSRVYLAGDTSKEGNSSRLYFSSVISSAGNITWTPTVDFVDINPGDGEGIKAIKRFALELLVFKPNYIYRFRTSATDPDPLIKVGTLSQESVIEGTRGLYFFHDTGFYQYTGGYPVKISSPIVDIVKAIPFSQYDDIIAWSDQDNIYWSVGNLSVTENGLAETWKNVIVRYTESSQAWTVYSTAWEPRAGVAYNNGSSLSRLIATDMGVVATWDSGTTDLGEPIKYSLRTRWYEWEGISASKVIQEIVATCEKAQGCQLMYQVDEDTAWRTIGDIKSLVTYFLNLSIRFHRIRFKVAGISRSEAPVFKGIEIAKGTNEGLTKN